MFISINSSEYVSPAFMKNYIQAYFEQNIILYRLDANEQILDQYLKTQFKIDLKTACLTVYNQSKIYTTPDSVVLKFITKEANTLAKLITYGINGVNGSRIIRNACGADKYR